MVVNKKITITMILALLQISITHAGQSALHQAAEGGQVATVTMLLAQAGTDIDKANDDGWTPLHLAAMKGREEVVKLLIQDGADVNRASYYESTPLHLAAMKGHANIVRQLLNAGAHANEANSRCGSLHFAIQLGGHTKIIKLLIQAGADIDIAANDGTTPLYLAVDKGRTEIVSLLLQANANPNIKNYLDTPPQLGPGHRRGDCIETLLELCARGVELTDNIETVPFFREKPRFLAHCKSLSESRLCHINQFFDEAITRFNLEADHCNSVIDHSLLPFMLPEGQLHQLREMRSLRAQAIRNNRSTLSSDNNRPTKRQKRSNQ